MTVHGSGEPEVAVVGGIHGDEPSGVRAVERLRAADPPLERGVKLVVANPPAVAAGERYLETDLNRSFPGDPDGSLEERLAAELCAETDGLPTLSLHATHSTPEPMALLEHGQPGVFELADSLPVPHVVDHSQVTEGSFTDCGTVVTVEAGCQGTDAAAAEAPPTGAGLPRGDGRAARRGRSGHGSRLLPAGERRREAARRRGRTPRRELPAGRGRRDVRPRRRRRTRRPRGVLQAEQAECLGA
ncbi:succinylglutamate desuccinylase [Halobacteriales archaeon QS_8_69_73]|nr:MAG: succinylglutamate desuccinylase [Halobacteriales archaeon QS_8_69_73]